MPRTPRWYRILAVALAFLGLLHGDELPGFIGKQPVPGEAPFAAKAGTVNADLQFTESWYTDFLMRWPQDKPVGDPVEIQAAMAKLNVPIRIYFPKDFDPKHHYPLFIANFTEYKDSRDTAGGYAAMGNAAGYVVAGFCLTDELKKQPWCEWKVRAAVCLYAASTIARWAPIDPNRIYVGGHSGGSKISISYYISYPSDYAGLMVLGCNQNPPIDGGKVVPFAVQAKGAAIFMGTGAKDDIAKVADSKRVYDEIMKSLKFPYALYADHDGGHAVVDGQLKTAFEFYNTSYADWYAKAEAFKLKEGLASAKSKHYGQALFPLLMVASFKPDSDKGKQAQAQLDLIEQDRTDAIATAEKLVGDGKKSDAKKALLEAARRFQGSWYQFELADKAKAIAK